MCLWCCANENINNTNGQKYLGKYQLYKKIYFAITFEKRNWKKDAKKRIDRNVIFFHAITIFSLLIRKNVYKVLFWFFCSIILNNRGIISNSLLSIQEIFYLFKVFLPNVFFFQENVNETYISLAQNLTWMHFEFDSWFFIIPSNKLLAKKHSKKFFRYGLSKGDRKQQKMDESIFCLFSDFPD